MSCVFFVKVKIPFSHVLKQAYTFCKQAHISGNFSFFLEQAKYTAIYTTIKLKTMFSNKWFSSYIHDRERKKKDT